jgi:hypothetical protein
VIFATFWAWAKAHWKLLAVPGLFLAGVLAGRFTRPQPAVHAETDSKSVAASAAVRQETSTGGETDRTTVFYGAGGYTGAETPLFPTSPSMSPAPGNHAPGAAAAPGANPCGVVAVVREHVGPVTTQVQEQTQRVEAQDLRQTVTVEPSARAGWAIQVGADDVLGARAPRVELRRRLFGQLWAGASAVPTRKQLGLSASFEF